LGIGLRFEAVTQLLQAFALLFVVFDDAVVHQRHALADMRVRVGLGDAAVGGPARVADAERSLDALALRGGFHLRDPPGPAHPAPLAAADAGVAGRVVAA